MGEGWAASPEVPLPGGASSGREGLSRLRAHWELGGYGVGVAGEGDMVQV